MDDTSRGSPRIANDLLRTKFAPPQPSASLVRRESLLARLDEALQVRLTLVSAPAGFGKSALVSEWLNELRMQNEELRNEHATHLSQCRVAWLTLDADDNDPVRFWHYLIAACQVFEPAPEQELGQDALAQLRTSAQTLLPNVVNSFINDLTRLRETCVLVIEDYHVITSAPVHETVSYWLEHLPAPVHVILLTRSDPPFPLARLRARDQLREIRASDLRFTRDEAEAFMHRTFGDAANVISPDLIAQLDARIEGWPAGWRMLALLAQRQRDKGNIEHLAVDFDGTHQHVTEYFISEVLRIQPPHVEAFLLRTSFLDRFNAALCNAVTGRDDSAVLLDQLERENLFLQRLRNDSDGHGYWYRYHSLFAESMQQLARRSMSDGELRNLFSRALAWFEAGGHLSEAIEAAFSAHEMAQAAALIEQFFERRQYNELISLRRWLEQLPQDELYAHPMLCFASATATLFTLDRHAPATRARIEPALAQAEALWRAEGNGERLGELLAFRATVAMWQGEYEESTALAREALQRLPEHNAEWRGVSLLQVAGDDLRAGRMADLPGVIIEARALCAAAGNKFAANAALDLLGETSYWRGELRQASQFFTQVIDEASAQDMLSDRQQALTGLGRIAFEQNNLAAARQHLADTVALGVQADEPDFWNHAVLMQLRVQHASGETAQAYEALRQFIATVQTPDLIYEAHLLRARLALLDSDLPVAKRALTTLPKSDAIGQLLLEQTALLNARVLIAQHRADEALKLIVPWREDAHANERARSEMESALIEALAHSARGDASRAKSALADALALAQAEGINRPFIEVGAPLAALLRASLPHWYDATIEAFARECLAAMGEPVSDAASSNPPLLIEPLSAQEQRVLRLLAAGMTNAEIARELIVSVNTVKTQTQSIYRKLNVNSRDEARDAARRLRLV